MITNQMALIIVFGPTIVCGLLAYFIACLIALKLEQPPQANERK